MPGPAAGPDGCSRPVAGRRLEGRSRARRRRPDALLPPDAARVKGSILDLDALVRAAGGCDRVIHLAAMVGVKRTEAQPLRCMDVNVTGTHHVLAAAHHAGALKVVFASSSEVYGEPATNPIDEAAATQGRTVYAVSKLAGEELCKGFALEHGLCFTILRLFNVYGPWQSRQFVVPRFVDAVRRGEPPTVYGTGEQRRGYAFVTDTAHAVVRAGEQAAGEGRVGEQEQAVGLAQGARRVEAEHAGRDHHALDALLDAEGRAPLEFLDWGMQEGDVKASPSVPFVHVGHRLLAEHDPLLEVPFVPGDQVVVVLDEIAAALRELRRHARVLERGEAARLERRREQRAVRDAGERAQPGHAELGNEERRGESRPVFVA